MLNSPTPFHRLLAWLDADEDRAAEKYEEIRLVLRAYLKFEHGCHDVELDELIELVIERVTTKLCRWRIADSEVRDANVMSLYGKLGHAVGADSPACVRRVREFLPPDVLRVVEREAARATPDGESKRLLIKALNGILPRRDFYQERAFAEPGEIAWRRGVPAGDIANLPPDELEKFNRLLLEACFPEIETSLQYREVEDRTEYFKRVADFIVREKRKKEGSFEIGTKRLRGLERDTQRNFDEIVEHYREGERRVAERDRADREQQEDLHLCLDECMSRLPEWKCALLLTYYRTKITPAGEEGERRTVDVRRELADKLGLSPGAMRVAIHRIKQEVSPCILACMVRKGYDVTDLASRALEVSARRRRGGEVVDDE